MEGRKAVVVLSEDEDPSDPEIVIGSDDCLQQDDVRQEVAESIQALAAQNRESRIARFLELRAWNRQKFRSEKQKSESNRSKVKSRKIDSESPSESHPIHASSDLGIARFESHDSESLDSQLRIADAVPLRSRRSAPASSQKDMPPPIGVRR